MDHDLPISIYELHGSSRVRISCDDIGRKDISYIIVTILGLKSKGQWVANCYSCSRTSLVQDQQADPRTQWILCWEVFNWYRTSSSKNKRITAVSIVTCNIIFTYAINPQHEICLKQWSPASARAISAHVMFISDGSIDSWFLSFQNGNVYIFMPNEVPYLKTRTLLHIYIHIWTFNSKSKLYFIYLR